MSRRTREALESAACLLLLVAFAAALLYAYFML